MTESQQAELQWWCRHQPRIGLGPRWFRHAGHAYATDGRAMVRVPEPELGPDPESPPGSPASPKFLASLPGFFAPAVAPLAHFDADDLRQWLGDPPPDPFCPYCGVSPDPDPAEAIRQLNAGEYQWVDPVAAGPGCDECGLTGYARPDPEPVAAFGRAIDATYLRRFLGLSWAAGGLSGSVWTDGFRGACLWRVGAAELFVMPMSLDADATRPRYAPGVGRLWHLRHTNKRFVLEDWCEERGLRLADLEPVEIPDEVIPQETRA